MTGGLGAALKEGGIKMAEKGGYADQKSIEDDEDDDDDSSEKSSINVNEVRWGNFVNIIR